MGMYVYSGVGARGHIEGCVWTRGNTPMGDERDNNLGDMSLRKKKRGYLIHIGWRDTAGF